MPWILALALCLSATAAGADPLPSWKVSPRRTAVTDFVSRVTDAAHADFVAPGERIAVFDNDGTLWAEQPLYFQALFAFDRVRALADQHPEWKTQEPYASVLRGDTKAALAGGTHALLEMVAATHAGLTGSEFREVVAAWLESARHPKTGQRYDAMLYQPMLELLSYLRENGFQTWIVSGGGIDFLRVFAEKAYGIPPEQVVGSSLASRYEVVGGNPVIRKLPKLDFVDDKEGKPVAIDRHIGRRPRAAFGNSDGDFEMLEWTTSGVGARLGMLVHHDDAEREWAYDRDSHVGQLARGLDEAAARGWHLVSMKDDWARIFPAPAP